MPIGSLANEVANSITGNELLNLFRARSRAALDLGSKESPLVDTRFPVRILFVDALFETEFVSKPTDKKTAEKAKLSCSMEGFQLVSREIDFSTQCSDVTASKLSVCHRLISHRAATAGRKSSPTLSVESSTI